MNVLGIITGSNVNSNARTEENYGGDVGGPREF
jgi:hypothetical protein